MKIHQIRNATLIVTYNGKKFLIDPWLGPKDYMPGFEGAYNSHIRQPREELPIDIKTIVDVDAVILTHFHPDHWDKYAEEAIKKDIPFFVQSKTDYDIISSYGFNNIKILSYDGTEIFGTTLYKTDCQHGKREIIKPICESIGMPYDAMGVVFKTNNEKTLYIAGDTIFVDEETDAELSGDENTFTKYLWENHAGIFEQAATSVSDRPYYTYMGGEQSDYNGLLEDISDPENFQTPTIFMIDFDDPESDTWTYGISDILFNFEGRDGGTTSYALARTLIDCWNHKGIFAGE